MALTSFSLINPHKNYYFFKPISEIIGKNNVPEGKLVHIWKYISQAGNVNIILTERGSSLTNKKLPLFFIKLEFKLWMYLNKLNNYNIKIYSISDSYIQKKPLLIFSREINLNFIDQLKYFKNITISTNHFFVSPSVKGELVKKLIKNKKVNYLSEFPVTESKFFLKYYPFLDEKIVNYTISSRFKKEKPIKDRISKCAVLGSLTYFSKKSPAQRDFMNYFKTNTYHPSRSFFYENKSKFRNADILVTETTIGTVKKRSLYKKVINYFDRNYGSYFDQDLNKLMNNYRLVYYAEDCFEMIPKGAFEAIMSGCVIIGQKKYFERLGFVHLEHFIGIENIVDNIDDFDNIIVKYVNDIDLLNKISLNSINLIQSWNKNDSVF